MGKPTPAQTRLLKDAAQVRTLIVLRRRLRTAEVCERHGWLEWIRDGSWVRGDWHSNAGLFSADYRITDVGRAALEEAMRGAASPQP